MKETVRIASVGLNNRGYWQTREIAAIPGVEVTAVCDVYEDLCDRMAEYIEQETGKRPVSYTDY